MAEDTPSFDACTIDASLVTRLIAAQFPQWADLPIRAADPQGNDNRTFRLGNGLAARLPSAPRYAAQVEKEQEWLPRLALHLPLPIPAPVARGAPGDGYPFSWSVNRWLEGETVRRSVVADPVRFATGVATFLRALRSIDPAGAPAPGPHCFWRGGSLLTYDQQTRAAISTLGEAIDRRGATEAWEAALAAPWRGPDVWYHGDVAADNLLVDAGGSLNGVIDFGCCGVGDPACDLVLAWTFLDGEPRAAFRDAVALDAGTWARARGWALWKAVISCAAGRGRPEGERSPRVINEVIAEHRARG